MPCEANKLKTKRNTIFGRGFVNLDGAKIRDFDPQNNFCMLMVSEFEIKVLKAYKKPFTSQGQGEGCR